ncbi:MAG: hypothetical protein ACREQJ_08750, partial [Candidatus Binatia bacterium]
ITEAVDLLRKTGAPINSDSFGTIMVVEVKSTTGSDRFGISNAIKKVKVDRSPGAYPMPDQYVDKTANVVTPVTDAKEKTDIVVDGSQGAGDVAFSIFRHREANKFRADDAKHLDEAVRELDPFKAREQFVDHSVDDLISRNLAQIRQKQKLQRAGGTVNTPIPLEAEYNAAFAKVYGEELKKRGAAGAKDAIAAAEKAGARAVRETIESGRIVTHTGEKYADHFAKTFDAARADFASKNPDIVKKNEETRKKQARERQIAEFRKALTEAINKADPKSPATDDLIAVTQAFVTQFPDQTFLIQADARKGLVNILGDYGFKDIDEVGSFQNERARLDYALGNFAALDPSQRKALREGKARPQDFGIKIIITYEEMMDRENQLVTYNVKGTGMSIQIPRREKREAEQREVINHALGQLNQIRGAGPLSLLGRIAAGEKGAVVGGLFDSLLPAASAGRARAQQRSYQDSGGHVVRRDAPLKPVNVQKAPAPPPRKEVQPDRPPPPARIDTNLQGATGGKRDKLQVQPGNQPPVVSNKAPEKAPQKPPSSKPDIRSQPTGQGADTLQDVKKVDRLRQERAVATGDRDKAIATVTVNGQISVDRVLDRLESGRGDGTLEVVMSLNRNRHRGAFEDQARRKLGSGEEPPPVFRDGNVVRVDPARLSVEQRRRLETIATRPNPEPPPPPQRPVDPRARTQQQIDPNANTQQRPVTIKGPPFGAPRPPANVGQGGSQQGGSPPPGSVSSRGRDTVRIEGQGGTQQAKRDEKKTAEIPRQSRDDVATGKFPAVAKPQVSSAELEK